MGNADGVSLLAGSDADASELTDTPLGKLRNQSVACRSLQTQIHVR